MSPSDEQSEPGEQGAADLESSAAQRYFRRVEDVFIELRGAPLLLSPQDWQIARGWYERGIPLALVETTLRDLFERRRAREIDARVNRLSYCASAVEEAFGQLEEMLAPGARAPEGSADGSGARTLDVAGRLRQLARSVEGRLGETGEGWGARIGALRGDAESVEHALADLEVELLDEIAAGLDPERREVLRAEVEQGLSRVGERLEETQRRLVTTQLRARWLRREAALPRLSLFSAELSMDREPEH